MKGGLKSSLRPFLHQVLQFKNSRKTLQHEYEAHKIILSEKQTISDFFMGS